MLPMPCAARAGVEEQLTAARDQLTMVQEMVKGASDGFKS